MRADRNFQTAGGIAQEKLFGAVTEEVGQLLCAELAGMARYNSDDTVTVLATWAADGEHPLIRGPWRLEGGPRIRPSDPMGRGEEPACPGAFQARR